MEGRMLVVVQRCGLDIAPAHATTGDQSRCYCLTSTGAKGRSEVAAWPRASGGYSHGATDSMNGVTDCDRMASQSVW